MRIRNVKNKEEILNQCSFLIMNPKDYKGKWQSLFQNDHPIYLEIGCGKGKFLYENALKYPEINFIGIERYDSILALAIEKMKEHPKNLYLVRMNAMEIEDVFDFEIRRLYLNFSDPWPKKRHALRRLSSPIFLETKSIFVQIIKVCLNTL